MQWIHCTAIDSEKYQD